MFFGIPDLYPLDASSNPFHHQMSHGSRGHNRSQLRTPGIFCVVKDIGLQNLTNLAQQSALPFPTVDLENLLVFLICKILILVWSTS